MSGKRGLLPAHKTVTSLHAPLRTVHVSFPTYGSSISKALFQDQLSNLPFLDYGLAYDNLDGKVLDFHLCLVRHPFSRLCGVYAIHFLLLFICSRCKDTNTLTNIFLRVMIYSTYYLYFF